MDDTPILKRLRDELASQTFAQDISASQLNTACLIDELIATDTNLNLIQACDLLERACAAGDLYVVQSVCEYVDFFIYRSFALVLSLRSAHDDIALWLIEHEGVDLLAPISRPDQINVMLPPDSTFTRSALTKSSTYLFLNILDPTPATYILRDYSGFEHLDGKSYKGHFLLSDTARCIHTIIEKGIVDNTVYDDIFRSYIVYANRKFRDRHTEQDLTDAKICLQEAEFMLELHEARKDSLGYGDERLYKFLEDLIVPKCPDEIFEFLTKLAPDVLLKKLYESKWLQDDFDCIANHICDLKPAKEKRYNSNLLICLAMHNKLDEIKYLETWYGAFDNDAFDDAIAIASDLEFIEMAAYLLSLKSRILNDEIKTDSDDLLGQMLL